MSRNTPASSRLKISNPTLISSTAQGGTSNRDPHPDLDFRGAGGSLGIGQVWNGNQAAPAPAASSGPARTNGNGSGEPARLPPPKPTSPSRPARSRARGAPDDGLQIPPARSPGVPPISTRQLSVHSNGGAPESPTTPMSPEVSRAGASGGDPWAADRAQRTVARQQTNDTAQMANLKTPVSAGGNQGSALRNAAAAFMAASKQSRRDEQQGGRRPPRPKRTQPSKDDWDDIVGTTGGRFAEIDGACRSDCVEQTNM